MTEAASNHFDAIVIGSGTSAHYCITGLSRAGRKIAVIDERAYGGTCALRGCQPKKYLVANAEAIAMSRRLGGRGVDGSPHTNWAALQGLKNEFLDGHSEWVQESFESVGISTYHGRGTMVAPDAVAVGKKQLTADHIVIATGAQPRLTAIPGSEFVRDSEFFLDMPELPKRITFVGGGYISFEFAHVAALAGSEVAILHRSAQPLKAFEPEMVEVILAVSEDLGVKVVTNESPVEIREEGDGFVIEGASGARYATDLVIEATGRLPNLSVLAGDQGEVAHSPRGIAVNEHLQSTTNSRVYAIGDCVDALYQLATVADEQGKVAAHNIIHPGRRRTVDYSIVPSAVFTVPSLASVGLTEAQAIEQGRDFRIKRGRDME